MKPILTASRLETKQRCDMRDYYSYERNYRPVGLSKGLAIGTMVHKGLESFWKQQTINEAYDAMETVKKEEPLFWEGPHGELAHELSHLYVYGYYKKYQEEMVNQVNDGLINNIEVEKEFCVEIEGHTFAGKLDVLYFDKQDNPVIIEHKTASSLASDMTSPYWTSLPMNIQLTIYKKAIQQLYGTTLQPITIYDVILTTTKKPSQKRPYLKKSDFSTPEEHEEAKLANLESPEEFIKRIGGDYYTYNDPHKKYRRQEIITADYAYNDRFRQLLLLEKTMPSNRPEQERYRNTAACSDYGGCPFLDVCLGHGMLESAAFTKKKKRHPELKSV